MTDRATTKAWVLALVFIATWAFRFLSTTTFHNDQYMHLAWANQVLGGDVPIRDFVDPGMPLTYLTSAAAQLIVGRGAWAEAVLSFTLLSVGAALTCHLAARASGSLLLGLAAALVQVVMAPRLYSAPKILLPLCALWAYWRYADSPSRRTLLGVALCTAIAFLVRHDHGGYIGAAATVLLVALHWPDAARPVVTYAGCVALLLLPFFAFVQWNGGILDYLRTGLSFSEAEYTGRRVERWPRFDLTRRTLDAPEIDVRWAPAVDAAARARVEAEHGLHSPVQVREQTWRYRLTDDSPSNVRALINRSEIEDTAGIDRGAARVSGVDETMLGQWGRAASRQGAGWLTALLKRENAIAWTYLLFTWVPPLVLLILGVAWLRPSWRFDSGEMPVPVLSAAAALGAFTNEGFLRDPLEVRLADASAVTLVLSAWLGGRFLTMAVSRTPHPDDHRRRARWARASAAAAAMTIVLAAAGVTFLSAAELGSLGRALEKTRVVEGPRLLVTGARATLGQLNTHPPIDGWLASGDEQRELKQLTHYIRECTTPDDRLLVTWFAPEVYFYSERRFAAGLAFFYPGFFAEPAAEEAALGRLRSQPVPIVLAEVSSFEQSFVRDHPRLSAYLRERYAVVGEVAAAEGSYRVLADRRAVPVRTASPWSLPCFR